MIKAIETLGKHDRSAFSCGVAELDAWFHQRAGQDDKRNVTRVFVAVDDQFGVVGFYSLSSFTLALTDLPREHARRLPRYDAIPAALIGRLARDERVRGEGVGDLLLADAVRRVLGAAQSLAVFSIVVDAKNEAATVFYRKFGFAPFPSRPLRLFIPVADVLQAMSRALYALYPHMTVRQNMGFALRYAGAAKAEIERQVMEAAQILELGPLLDRKPGQLSGGQRQRVAIGRAIVRHPKVFLFDEPLSNLDAELRVHMRIEIAKLHRQLATTMVYVTHDQVEAMTLADKIVVLRAGQVEQVGAPLELYNNPENIFVAGFIGSPKMNFFKAEPTGEPTIMKVAGVRAPAPGGLMPAGPLTLGVRPEHFDRDGAPDIVLEVSVDAIEQLGGTAYIHGRAPSGETIVVERRDNAGVRPGQTVKAGFTLADGRWFDAQGLRVRPKG